MSGGVTHGLGGLNAGLYLGQLSPSPVVQGSSGLVGYWLGFAADLDHPNATASRLLGPWSFSMRRDRRKASRSLRRNAVALVGVVVAAVAVVGWLVDQPAVAGWSTVAAVGCWLAPGRWSTKVCTVVMGPPRQRWSTMPAVTRAIRAASSATGQPKHRGLMHDMLIGPPISAVVVYLLTSLWWPSTDALVCALAAFGGYGFGGLFFDWLTTTSLPGLFWPFVLESKGAPEWLRFKTGGPTEYLIRYLILLPAAIYGGWLVIS